MRSALCVSAPIVVEPGASYRAQAAINVGRPGSNFEAQFATGPVDGVYRLVWSALSYAGPERDDVPPGERVSNRFTLSVR